MPSRTATVLIAPGKSCLSVAERVLKITALSWGVSPRTAAGLLLVGLSTGVWAQATDAGRVYDSLQKRGPQVLQPQAPSVNLKPAETAASVMPSADTQLEVKQFKIEGATLLAQPKLEAIVRPFAGRTLTVAQLQEAADTVAQAYRDAGYMLVQAAVLPQTIQDGVVTITVREGRLTKLDIVSTQAGRPVPSVVQAGLEQSVRTGEPVNTPLLEESLLLVNDLPSRGRASAEIAPGEQAGSSTVNIGYVPAARVAGSVQADNWGGRFTGRNRLFGQLYVNDPLGLADQLSLGVLTTGSLLSSVQAGYRVPLGLRTTIGISGSKLTYSLCCQTTGLSGGGDVGTLAIDAAYNVRLLRGQQITLFAQGDTKRLETDTAGVQQTQRSVQGLTLGARGYWSDAAYNGWSASLRGGKADLSDNAADLAFDAAGAQVQGNYSKFNASFYRSQAISGAWSWQLNLRGQRNLGRNLESSERYVLGGSDGVRAYPSGEAVGDSGWLVTLELRYALAALPGLSLGGFVDTGGIRRFSKNTTLLTGTVPNTYQLSGAGLGLRYDTEAVSLALVWAKPVGNNRGLDAAGNNNEARQDGSRAWVTAAWRF
jgi:hemolysin activation/secretion protein